MKTKITFAMLIMLILFALVCIGFSAFRLPQDARAQLAEGNIKLKKFDVLVKTLGGNHEPKQQFKVGDSVFVQVLLTNKSKKTVRLTLNSELRENRLLLMKDGTIVPFRSSVAEQFALEDQDEEAISPSGSFQSLEIAPNQTAMATFTELSRWYEPLEPGSYELSVERRFKVGKLNAHLPEPVKSSTVSFVVLP